MNVGHIFIDGQIGNTYDDNGNVTEKGVELIDVAQQLQSIGDVETVHVHINSPGGFVEVGNSISELLASVPNCFTIAEGLCASIATKIHLSVPLENRMIQEGCEYMIHNPFLQNVTGDAAQLQALTDSIKSTEEILEKEYAKATGLDKGLLSALMAKETYLTPELCVEFKFASSIIKKEQARAVALLYTEKQKNMNKDNNHTNRLAGALAVLKGSAVATPVAPVAPVAPVRVAVALALPIADGTLDTPFEDLMVDDDATIAGEPANGTFEVTEGDFMGWVIVAVEGKITEITPVDVDAENDIEALKLKLKASEDKNTSLEADLTTANTEKETIVAQVEAAAALQSDYVAPAAQAAFRAQPKAPEAISRDGLAERRKAYKKKN